MWTHTGCAGSSLLMGPNYSGADEQGSACILSLNEGLGPSFALASLNVLNY